MSSTYPEIRYVTTVELRRALNKSELSNILAPTELAIVKELLLATPVIKNKGHNLYKTMHIANSTIARWLGRNRETIRQNKEKLHARNIILLDNKTWEQYLIENDDGSLRRPLVFDIQSITFSNTFIEYIFSYAKGDADVPNAWSFDYCEQFKIKINSKRQKAKEAIKRFYQRISGNPVALLKPNPPALSLNFIKKSKEFFGYFKIAKISHQSVREMTDSVAKTMSEMLKNLIKDFGYDENKAVLLVANQIQRHGYAANQAHSIEILHSILARFPNLANPNFSPSLNT